jgi:hypothetical protein
MVFFLKNNYKKLMNGSSPTIFIYALGEIGYISESKEF